MDDRDQELADLKARLAALENAPSNAPSETPQVVAAPQPKRMGCFSIGAMVVAGGLGLLIFFSVIGHKLPDGPDSKASTSTPCDQTWAAEMVADAQSTRVVERMDVTPDGFIAIVNGRRFESLSYAAKEQIAVAIDCQIAGNRGHLTSVHFRRSMHAADLAEFKAIDLLNARKNYAAAGWTRR